MVITLQALFVFVVLCLIKASMEECKMPPQQLPPESEFIDLQFWKEYYEQTETCINEMKNIRKQQSHIADGLAADLWEQYVKSPINEMINSVPCKKKSFDKILRNSTVENIRSGLGKIPVIDDQMQNFWDVFTGGPEGNSKELKDEIWKANETILCALSMNTAEIREMLKDQTTPIDGTINNRTIEIKDFVNMIAEDLKNATKDFQLNMNKRFDELSADKAILNVKLTNISARLSKTPISLAIFAPTSELYGWYKLCVGKPSPNQYTARCQNPMMNPIGALVRLKHALGDMGEMMDILKTGQFSDGTYNEFYKAIIQYLCDAVELIFNCHINVTYESQLIDEILKNVETALDTVNELRKKRMQTIA